jgi:hypothetical protein
MSGPKRREASHTQLRVRIEDLEHREQARSKADAATILDLQKRLQIVEATAFNLEEWSERVKQQPFVTTRFSWWRRIFYRESKGIQ